MKRKIVNVLCLIMASILLSGYIELQSNAEKYFNAAEGTATTVNASGVTVPVSAWQMNCQ